MVVEVEFGVEVEVGVEVEEEVQSETTSDRIVFIVKKTLRGVD